MPTPHDGTLRTRAIRSWGSLLLAIAVLVGVVCVSGRADAVTLTVFGDGFESGSLSAWTSAKGVVVQTNVVASGTYAARATTRNVQGFAAETLGTAATDVTLSSRVDLLSNGSAAALLRLRTATGAGIGSTGLSRSCGARLACRTRRGRSVPSGSPSPGPYPPVPGLMVPP